MYATTRQPVTNGSRWTRIQELFHEAISRPTHERPEFLDEACDDAEVRSEVEALVNSHERGGFVTTLPGWEAYLLKQVRELLADRYNVQVELARGGMAIVFLAEDVRHERQVAIKLLRPELAGAIGTERFLREIKLTAQLNHPLILPLLDSGRAGDFLYYVTPYIEGESLRERLNREGGLSVEEATHLAGEVADALDAAHEQGVVHRDIKLENILLSRGHALVADFGIARALDAAAGGSQGMKTTGMILGTPDYMAPEQAVSAEITPATDVYSLGAVLYELLTGRNWNRALATGEIDWSGIPRDLTEVLRRALEKVPRDRWVNGGAFRRALMERPKAKRGLLHRRRGVVAIAVAGVLALAVVGGVVLRSAGSGPASAAASRVAVLPFSVRGSGEFAYLGEGMVDLLSTKLSGVGDLRSADPRAVLSVVARENPAAPAPEMGRRVARNLNAGFYVLGNVVEVRGRLRIDAAMYGAEDDANVVAQASAEGDAARIFDLVDEVAAELLVGRRTGPGDRSARIAALTTDNLAALKAYLEGEQAFRRAQFSDAVEVLQRAVELDSSFALAWFRLSTAAQFLAWPALTQQAAEQAVRYSGRLSERDRAVLTGMQAERRGDAQQAEVRYRAVIEAYPDDVEAWQQLAEVLFHYGPLQGRSPAEAREAWERVIRYEPGQGTAFLHLARIAVLEGNRVALDTLVRAFEQLDPEGARASDMRALRAFATGDRTARDAVLADLGRGSDRELVVALFYVGAFAGDLDGAGRIAQLLTQPGRPGEARALGHVLLAHLKLAACDWDDARAELAQASRADPVQGLLARAFLLLVPFVSASDAELDAARQELERWDARSARAPANNAAWFAAHAGVYPHLRAYLLGSLAAVRGDITAATRHLNELGTVSTSDEAGTLAEDLAAGVGARIALARGDSARALAALEAAPHRAWWQLASFSPFFSQPHERYLRGRLLEQAGRTEEALRQYGSFAGFSVHDLIYQAAGHMRTAEIYQQMGEAELAAESLARVISDCGLLIEN